MIKWLMLVVFAGLAAWSWMSYTKKGETIETMKKQIEQLQETGDPEELAGKLSADLQGMEGEKIFNGILLTFLGAGVVGIVFVSVLLPLLAQKVTHSVYDSGEQVEKDAMSSARSLVAQGDYAGAITAYQEAAAADPLNRLPWVEIAKIQKDHLQDAGAAIQTIRHALESQEWEVNDAAYFLFRLAELYDEVEGDRASAIAIMNQVVQEFPGTRHSANATHKLHEWAADGDVSMSAEEAEYLARVKAQREGQ
ncbi:MAG: tetratricopeptide repeat protein [Verrucomicrobiota bacterium]